MFVSEIYSIEDLYGYDSLTSNSGHWTSNDNKAITSYSDNGCTLSFSTASALHSYSNNIELPSNFSLEIKITDGNKYNNPYFNVMGISIIRSNNSYYRIGKANTGIISTTSITPQANDVLKWVYENGTMSIYINDTLITSNTPNKTGFWIECDKSHTNSQTYKDLKIKAL